jgi:hypothetical protein
LIANLIFPNHPPHVPALIKYSSFLLVDPNTSAGIATLKKRYRFRQSSGIFIKSGTSPFCERSYCEFQVWKNVPMDRKDLYLSYAADCQQMAYITRNEHERLIWLDVAQSGTWPS